MEEENEYKKLPTEDKCVHKLWKARIAGYEEAIKLFNQIEDEKSPEWNKYLGLIKKFVTDGNAVAQERGLEAALVFVENCGLAGKTTGEVMSGIVAKCIAAPKTKTKDLALQVTLMYVEIEKPDVVQEELMKGMEQKNPKVVAACTGALTSALKQFGNKVVGIKPMVKKIPILLADRDKGVRDEMKALVVEMHRWIGPAIEPHIASLQPVVQQELREAFGSVGAAQPTRYLKSQQHKMAEQVTRGQDDGDGACDDEDGDAGSGDTADMDPYDLMDPVEILSKLPKDFYNKLEMKKWQERKEALDALENLLKAAPRLEPGDFADLVRALKKMIAKDSNVMLVALAGRLLGMIASGLRNKFSPYAVACVEAILEKFKEKKTNVVTALREAIDAIYPSTNLEAIMEDMLNAFNNKNPSVKCESALFLARSLCKTQPAAFGKKLIKPYVAALLKLLDCAEPAVRDAAAEALGTAMKLVGEKNIAPHIDKLDNLKEQKIKEFAEKAVIQVKVVAPKKEKPKSTASKSDGGKSAGSADPKPVKRPTTATKKPSATKKTTAVKSAPQLPRETELTPEEVDAKAEMIFSPDILTGVADAGNWKTRLSAVQSFYSTVQSLTPDDVNSQVLYRILNKKPGLKDTNVQVLKARLEATKYITENFPVTATAADFIIHDIVNKLGEAACCSLSADNLTALAEHCNFEHVVNEGLTFAMDSQKNPKVQSEMFNWISGALKEFGMTLNIKPLIVHSKKAISATNPNVRTAAVNFIGTLSLYTGPSIINHFDSEKPATKQLISLELEKYANNSPPTPTKNISKSESKASMGDDIDENMDDGYDEPVPVEDNRTKTDIAPLITDSLIGEINDKNWKVRNEALDKLKTIISTSAPIKPSLGELPPALTARLVDSNSKLAQTALQICESLASAIGPKCKQHVRTFFPGFFQAFGDNKQWIRQAATSCVVSWCNSAGGAQVAFDGEMVYDALKTGSPVLRAELFQWIAEHVPNVPPKAFPREELTVCVPLLYACLEDRSAEVRKKAGDCVLPFMLHLGYEAMFKQLDKLKPGSKNVVQASLDKARPNLPVQPLPSKTKKDEPKGVKSGGALKKDEKKVIPAGKAKGIVKPSSASSRGKKDDEDTSPLLPCNNAKNQRIIDDQKLKVLKWNFTTPREEFFELLKEQMTSAGMNKQLVANMFHADFRYHLKSIEALSEDLQYNGQALMANLDLVLKWLTLRFFDTNPSVILKGLEYLSQVFTHLMDSDYTMAEYEANCFIPYLVLKVGDPKDTVRNGVKALFKQICVVYSVTKLFGYLMEGLKSKNARQRAECLDCIGVLLETYGSTVMSPSPSSALKELARHIGDRDNAVRSAALNCVANAYFLEGEKVYKMIGQISDKDLSLLEERIKRAGKTRSAETRRSMVIPLTSTGKPILQHEPQEMESRRVISVDTAPGEEYEEEEEQEDEPLPPPVVAQPVEPKVIPGPYGLDPELIARLDAEAPSVRKTNITEVDLKFLEEPISMPPVVSNIPRPATSVLPMSPPRRINTPSVVSHQSQHDETQLVDTIHSIASPDIHAAIRALSLVSGALAGGRGMGGGRASAGTTTLEERLLTAVAAQLRNLRSGLHSPADSLHAYKCIASVLSNLYEPGGYGSSVGSAALSSLLSELLRVLGGSTVSDGEKLVRILNNICVKMLEHSDRSELFCALVSLLQESIGVTDTSSPRYQELLMKCFWKALKMMHTCEVNSIDYDAVLYRIHLFYKAYPNYYWKKNTDISDTPNKTVKTLVHSLVKLKGGSITDHLTKIPDVQDSDLYHYLVKVLKQLKLDDKREPPGQDNMNGSVLSAVSSNSALNQRRLPRNVHDDLALILKKIGNKQHNQHALEQLYDLRESHPDIDIWTFMQGSSFYFRNYVERGLKDVAEQRRLAPVHAHFKPVSINENVGEFVDINNENDDTRHVVYLEKLRALQVKMGIKTESPTSQPKTPIDNRSISDSINDNNLPRHTIDPQLQLHSTAPQSHRSEAGMDALRLKLQQIKSSTKR